MATSLKIIKQFSNVAEFCELHDIYPDSFSFLHEDDEYGIGMIWINREMVATLTMYDDDSFLTLNYVNCGKQIQESCFGKESEVLLKFKNDILKSRKQEI